MMRLGAALLGVAVASPALAAEQGLRFKTDIGVRSNQLAAGSFNDVAWRTPLFESDSMLLRDTFIDVGVVSQLSPASFHPGFFVDIVPVALLRLRAQAQRLQYFGTFGSIAEYPDEEWDGDRLDEAREEGGGQRVGGYQLQGMAQLRLKLGPVLALGDVKHTEISVDVEDPFYESTFDLLLEPEDSITSFSAIVGYLLWGDLKTEHLAVAARYERYDTDKTDVTRQMLGGALLWRPPARWWSTGNPQILFLTSTFLDDPYREGELYIAGQVSLTFGAQ